MQKNGTSYWSQTGDLGFSVFCFICLESTKNNNNNNNMESRSFTVITILFTALFCVSVVCPEEVLSIPTEFTLPQMRQQMKAKRKYKLVSNWDLHLVFFLADLGTFLFYSHPST